MKKTFLNTWGLARQTAEKWNNDNVFRLSAALSYYTIFSLAPLLLIATAVVGFIWGREAIDRELTNQLTFLLGKAGATTVNNLVAQAGRPQAGILATVVGIVTLIIGASGVFVELRAAFNLIWGVEKEAPTGVMGFVRTRLLSFAMVFSVGFLLLVSLLVNTVISIAANWSSSYFAWPTEFLQLLNMGSSLILITILFAVLFKFLPEAKTAWGDVWLGALITSVLFAIGKWAIGAYLGSSQGLGVFGPAASVILILMWTFYSSLILFFGAEFTVVHSKRKAARRESKRGVKNLVSVPAA